MPVISAHNQHQTINNQSKLSPLLVSIAINKLLSPSVDRQCQADLVVLKIEFNISSFKESCSQ